MDNGRIQRPGWAGAAWAIKCPAAGRGSGDRRPHLEAPTPGEAENGRGGRSDGGDIYDTSMMLTPDPSDFSFCRSIIGYVGFIYILDFYYRLRFIYNINLYI